MNTKEHPIICGDKLPNSTPNSMPQKDVKLASYVSDAKLNSTTYSQGSSLPLTLNSVSEPVSPLSAMDSSKINSDQMQSDTSKSDTSKDVSFKDVSLDNFGGVKIAVLIPCFNEAQTIFKVVTDFKQVLPYAQVFVFDNNSSDDTAKIATAAGAIVIPEYRQGKGNVVRSMFRKVDADVYIMVDGDNTYDATDAPKMIRQVVEQGVDMVIGDRLSSTYFSENKRLGHNFGNRLVRKLINSMFRVKHRANVGKEGKILDIMTGYRAFSKLFVKSFPVLSGGFEIETEMTIHALDKNFLVSSLPINYKDRPEGSVSKLNTLTDGIKVLWTILRLVQSYRPFFFFSMISLGCFLISLCFLVPVFVQYFTTGIVDRLPTMITGCFSLLCSLFSLFAGLLLDVLTRQQRQRFELVLNALASSSKSVLASDMFLMANDAAHLNANGATKVTVNTNSYAETASNTQEETTLINATVTSSTKSAVNSISEAAVDTVNTTASLH